MKELLQKLIKQTDETNAALQVNTALTEKATDSLNAQERIAKSQQHTFESLLNISKIALNEGKRETANKNLQENLRSIGETERAAFQKTANEKAIDYNEKAKRLQERAVSIATASGAILKLNLGLNLGEKLKRKKAELDAKVRATKTGAIFLGISDRLKGIDSLVQFSKDGKSQSETVKLLKFFKDKERRDRIAAKEAAQESRRGTAGKLDLSKRGTSVPGTKAAGFFSMANLGRNVLAFIGGIKAMSLALKPLLKSAGSLLGAKSLAGLKFVAKKFFVVGMVIAAFDAIKDAIKAFGDTEGNFGEKILAAIGEFSKTFVADIVGGTINALKWVGLKIAEFFGADTDGELFSALKNWSAVDAVKDLFDGIVNALTDFIVGLTDGIMEGWNSFGEDANILLKISGAIGGFFTGMTTGFVDMLAELLGSIISADPLGDEERAQMFKDFSLKDWFQDTLTPFFTETIPNAIGEFIYDMKQKFLDFIREKIAEPMVMGSIGVNNWLREYVQSQLPDRKAGGVAGFIGNRIIPDGIYDWAFGKGKDAQKEKGDAKKDTSIKSEDSSSIITQPKEPSFGQRLLEASNGLANRVVNIVNNNGGNVSNNTTSSQTNNTRTSSPIMMGSMGAY